MRRAVSALLLAAAGAAQAAEVELGYGHDGLSGGRPAWRTASLDVRLTRPDRATVAVSARDLERFGLRDLELALAAGAPWRGGWFVAGEASASTTHLFTPAWSGLIGVERALGAGFVASGRVRWARYEGGGGSSSPVFGSAGVERYFGRQRLAVTGHLAALEGSSCASGRLAWDLFYGDRSRVGLSLSGGRELESTGAPRPLATDVLAAAIGGRHAAGGAWSIAYEVGVQRQGDAYTRAGARLGLGRRF